MKLFRENEAFYLEDADCRSNAFTHEVATPEGDFNMHQFVIQNRNVIFGQYLYLLHEVVLSEESSIDFIGITEGGAVLLIEVKRGADTRNRQEVISQLGKYALDAYAISNLMVDENRILADLRDKSLQNKPFDKRLLTNLQSNVQNSNLNLFLVTEDASDEAIGSAYYLSYGNRNRKISIIELKRYTIDGQRYCFIREFNRQSLLNSTRKGEYHLEAKLALIENRSVRAELTRQIDKWVGLGFSVAPLSVSTPEYLTFEWKKGYSIWVYFYVLSKDQKVLSGIVRENTFAIYVDREDLDRYKPIIDWVRTKRNNYSLGTDNKGKSRDYHLYCLDVSDYDSDEFDEVFDKLREIAAIRRTGAVGTEHYP